MSIEQYDSLAGTDKQYQGNKYFRIRKNGDFVRLHLPKGYLRDRAKYVAIDLSLVDFVDAIKAAGLVTAGLVTRTITEIVMVPTEVTKEITDIEVVPA